MFWEYPPEEDECLLTKKQHFTVPAVLVEMDTLLKLSRVSMLLVVHMWKNKKDHEYALMMQKWHERYLVP